MNHLLKQMFNLNLMKIPLLNKQNKPTVCIFKEVTKCFISQKFTANAVC